MNDSTGRQNYYNKELKKIYSTKSISFRIIFNFSFYIKLKFKSFKVNFVLLLYFPFPEIYPILYFYGRIQKYIHFISIGLEYFLFYNLQLQPIHAILANFNFHYIVFIINFIFIIQNMNFPQGRTI